MTTFLLLALAMNIFAVVQPPIEGEDCCSEDGCSGALPDRPELFPAALCCMSACGQNAEANPIPAVVVNERRNQNLPLPGIVSAVQSISYIQQTRFPSSPTRHIAGSSIRYLEHNAFLI